MSFDLERYLTVDDKIKIVATPTILKEANDAVDDCFPLITAFIYIKMFFDPIWKNLLRMVNDFKVPGALAPYRATCYFGVKPKIMDAKEVREEIKNLGLPFAIIYTVRNDEESILSDFDLIYGDNLSVNSFFTNIKHFPVTEEIEKRIKTIIALTCIRNFNSYKKEKDAPKFIEYFFNKFLDKVSEEIFQLLDEETKEKIRKCRETLKSIFDC